jgi:hypothetical protein
VPRSRRRKKCQQKGKFEYVKRFADGDYCLAYIAHDGGCQRYIYESVTAQQVLFLEFVAQTTPMQIFLHMQMLAGNVLVPVAR